MPVKAGTHPVTPISWIPAFAGMMYKKSKNWNRSIQAVVARMALVRTRAVFVPTATPIFPKGIQVKDAPAVGGRTLTLSAHGFPPVGEKPQTEGLKTGLNKREMDRNQEQRSKTILHLKDGSNRGILRIKQER